MNPNIESHRSDWHTEPVEEVLEAFESSASGLSSEEARRRLDRYGPNTLPRVGGPGIWSLAWRQINDPLIYVLLASAVLALVMGKVVDGLVVLGVVILNMIIGFVQEYRAGKAIEALIDLVPNTAATLRNGTQVNLPAAELVPGDIVLLQSGDKAPADMRLLSVRNLLVQEAALTGESVAVSKGTAQAPAEAALGDRTNMVYSGTLVTSGVGRAVVVGTGAHTELGRISDMLREATDIETPLTRQIAKVGKALTVGISLVAVLLLLVGLVRGFGLVDAVLAGITLAVAAIPEGLPAIITIALAIGVQRMARRRSIIRKLPAVETLGSTTVICSDKTGTLTRGEMTVQALWAPQPGPARLTGIGYEPEGRLETSGREGANDSPGRYETLLRAGVLCNDASVGHEENQWTVSGDPTEGALIVAAEKTGIRAEETRRSWKRLDAVPFESERQYMASLHHAPEGDSTLYIKGAPEVIIGRIDPTSLGADLSARSVHEEVERLASQGMRVLAFAEKRVPASQGRIEDADLSGGFTLLGLQAMIDPPREEAVASVQACRRAGINVKMITGDHRLTAQAIGRQLGLLDESDRVYVGEEIEAMSDEELREAARCTGVFARVAPEHKLRLVRALQAEGQVVAMTGDGVNDAPALKQADIGVAMGITGTAVSKESADMVLADDNFASIAAAVEEGRRVYDNLIKSLAFVLPTNIGEALIILIAVMFAPIVGGHPLMPMEPVQILWINLVATVALALPLAFETMEPGLMDRRPRDPAKPILSPFVLFRTILVAVLMATGAILLFLYEYHNQLAEGVPLATALIQAQTVAVTTVILFQIFYLIQCRSLRDSVFRIGLFSNKYIYVGIAALLILQAAFIYVPFMNTLFGSAPLTAEALLKSLLASLIVLPVISFEKWLRQRRYAGRLEAKNPVPAVLENCADNPTSAEEKRQYDMATHE